RNRRRSTQRIEEFNLDELSPPIVTMADQRTMAQLLQAPTEGYEDAIVVPAITANSFELKYGLLTLRFNEFFSKAWDRFKDLLRACPHHGFVKLHQLDTFYNALNSKDQDLLNSAAGAYQAPAYQAPAPQTQGVSKEDFLAYVKANDTVIRNMKPQGQNMQNQLTNLTDLITKFVDSNSASTSSSGTIPSNTISNPRSDRKTITIRSGMAECLALADLSASINLMPFSVWKRLSIPDLTPTCMTLELADRLISHPVGVAEDVYVKVEVDAFLALEDDPTSPEVDQSYLDSERDILLLEAFLIDDPSLPPLNQGNYLPGVHKELKICEAKSDKSSIDEPPKVELKDLPPHLKYVFLESSDKLPIIIAKDLSMEEKTALITVLKSHKRAIAWKLFDIKGNDPEFCTHKIIMEEDFKPSIQHQRRVNPKIHDVIKQEVLKLLDAGLIYPIYGSPWVSPVHCVPKKGGFTVVENKENELILTRLVTG
nr:reverse transcriptase domain-containing protein [Tanacetum cinerariifolium]